MLSKRSWLLYLVLFIVLLGCFFMPSYVAGIADRSVLGGEVLLDAKSISFEAGSELAMPERLKLGAGLGRESIMVKNGKKLTESEAKSLALGELSRFFNASKSDFQYLDFTIHDCSAAFVINSDDPSINMVVWDFHLYTPDGKMMMLTLDEETGVILHIFYSEAGEKSAKMVSTSADENALKGDAERLCGLISDYYGVTGELVYELIGGLGYYNVKLYFDDVMIPLYGIVRTTGFSINE